MELLIEATSVLVLHSSPLLNCGLSCSKTRLSPKMIFEVATSNFGSPIHAVSHVLRWFSRDPDMEPKVPQELESITL